VNIRSLVGAGLVIVSILGAWLWMANDDADRRSTSLDVVIVPTGEPAEMLLVRHIRCDRPQPHHLCEKLRASSASVLRDRKQGICSTRGAKAGYAKVAGVWNGVRVKETLRLSDSCEQARWRAAMRPLGLPDYR